MELNPNDKKVVDLLSKLKNSNGAYPSDILAARRQSYLRQVANVGLGIGVGTGLKNATQSGNSAGTAATATSKILETVLIAAIAIEAGAIAFIYRDQIADLIRTYTGSTNVQEVASPSDNTSSTHSELVGITEAPSVTVATTPSGTVTITITAGTPSPEIAGDNNNNANNNSSNVGINVTPDPGGTGNQYGLTPKPERTKENDQNNNDGTENKNNIDTGNNNKP